MKFRFLLLHVFIGLGLYAQETPGFQILNYAAKTPEAAAFLKYGEYPVNLSTGVPNISIPLYTIDLKGYQMPITLDYHASGIKVEQEATWVGLGWNLNFGAQIILETHDDVDENNSQIYNMPTQADFDHYTSHPYAFDGGPIVSKELDKSRVKDSYFFSSPTASGRFYFKTATEIVVYPPEAFKVELDGSVFEHSSTGKKFKITDPAGNIYKFGAIETSYRKFSHFDYYKSAWYATSIETANREIINLVYEEGGVVEEHNSSQKVDVTKTVTKCGCTGENTSNHISQIINQGATTYTYTKKIKEISFNGGLSKVVFTRANNRDDVKSGAFTGGVTGQLYDSSRLDRITILHDNPGEEPDFVKGFEFEYTTFNPSGTMDEKRLRLSRIYDLVSGDYHQFIYNTSVALPAKNSMSKDYYGYYNGIINYNLIPPHFLTVPNVTTVGSANRSIIPDKVEIGTLKEIHYPTKGYTKFNYEGNTYYGTTSAPGTVAVDASTGSYHTEVDFPFVVDPDESLYFNFPFTVYTSTTGILTFKFTSNLHDDELHILNRQSIKVKILSGGPDGDDTGLPVVATDVTWDWNAAGDEATIIGTQAYSLGAGEHTIQVELYGQNVKLAATLNYTDTVVTTGDNPAAGLRIASIENYDFDNTLLTKKVYGYKNPATNKTSGQRTSDLGFNFISDTFKSFDPTYCPQTEGSAMLPRIDYTSTYSISSDSKYGVDGASVTYEYVQESSVDSLGVKLGLTEYKFSTGTDWYPHPSIIIPTPWKRGKLLEKTDYKIISSNRYPVRKEVNTYVEDNSKIVNVEGFKMRRLSNVPLSESQNPTVPPYQLLPECAMPSTVNFMVVFHKYNMVVPWEYLKKTEVTDYFYDSPTNISNTMLTSTQFNYNNPVHLQLSSRVTTTSRNETFETKYYYPGDASVQNEPQISNLISRNMISTPVKTENYLKGQKISEQKTIYNSWPSISGLPHILPEIIQAAKGDNATLENRIITEERDPAGNPTEVRLGNGLSVCYIWGYSDTHPVAKIENTSYASIDQDLINEIKEKSTYGTEEELIDKLNALRLSLPGKMITTYTFRPLIGIHTITDPRGYKMTYEIDNLGRLQYVRDSEGKILTENFYHYKD